jgi:hypothetical protein
MIDCLGDLFVDLIEEIVTEEYTNRPGNVFASLDKYELLNFLKLHTMRNESYLFRIPFIEDLTVFSIKKAMCQRKPHQYKSMYQTDRPKLNQAFISENEYDYLDLQNFLDRLEKEGPGSITPDKTAFIFLADEILSMSYITYRSTLKKFDHGFSLDDFYVLMRKKGIFTIPYHRELIAKLFENEFYIEVF